jgi:hypothetical protein
MIQEIKLSNQFKIYKTTFKHNFLKDDFKKRIEENKALYYNKEIQNNHSLEMNIECDEFLSIDNFFIKCLKEMDNTITEKISKFSWIYTQTKSFSTQWMHAHTQLHRFNKSHINTKWVCVFYIDIPIEMKSGEGDLLFKDEIDKFHSIKPKENDVIIFDGNIYHMTIPNQSSETDRISYVSNFNFI